VSPTPTPRRAREALIVDDDSLIREMIRAVLAEEGFASWEAENGRKGVTMLAEHPRVDLVITDILMPDEDGFEFLIEAKRLLEATGSTAKIIAISGGGVYAGSSFYLEPVRMLGAHAALAKPFSDATLLETVRGLGLGQA
jgi:CheY-like chemotaxis protein